MRQLEKELDKSQHTDGSGPGRWLSNDNYMQIYKIINP
jgi:hypothetical protein